MVNRALAVVIVLVGIAPVPPHARAQEPPARPGVSILSPADESYVSGPTVIRARVDPPAAAVSVTFYVDGRLVCRATSAPYDCAWDAGAAIAAHQIRVVAAAGSGAAGTRGVATIATSGAGFAERVDVDLVQVTATVTDGRSQYVTGLPQTAFRVYEDGRPQTITHFMSENVPLELVLAVDVSGSMGEAMPAMKAAVKEFLAAISPRDQVTLLGFNDTIFPLTRKSTDPAQRVSAVDRLVSWGGTALYDAIIAGVDLLGHETGRKAMLVFTDGEDQGSHSALSDVERRLEAGGVSLYVIAQGRGLTMKPLKKTMSRLAAATGGRALATDQIDDLRGAFTELLDELSHQYLLGYASTNSGRDGMLRRVKVEVDGRHQVRARDGYRAPEPR
jgi:VWFA-related protein